MLTNTISRLGVLSAAALLLGGIIASVGDLSSIRGVPEPSAAVPLGLPPLPLPPAAPSIVVLGKKLFFDRRLSFNGTMSCEMCHIEGQAFTSNQLQTSVGIEGKSLRRRAPSLWNVAYQKSLFRDGRETSLETQIWSPILSGDEMGAPSAGWELANVRSLPGYQLAFDAGFPGRGVTMDTVGVAIASYERTLLLADSPFDRWYYGGDRTALSPIERMGYELFTGKAHCSICHQIGQKFALFDDNQYHDTGLAYSTTMGLHSDHFDVRLAEGNYTRRSDADVQSISSPTPNDLGRFEVTQDPKDRWAFKTPSLRNVALTAPYMHDGSLRTLMEVVEYYNIGGYYSPNKSELIRPLHLSDEEKRALVAFLKSLTGTKHKGS